MNAINAIKLINSNFLFFIHISLQLILKDKYCNLFHCKRIQVKITVPSTKNSYLIEYTKNLKTFPFTLKRKRLKAYLVSLWRDSIQRVLDRGVRSACRLSDVLS